MGKVFFLCWAELRNPKPPAVLCFGQPNSNRLISQASTTGMVVCQQWVRQVYGMLPMGPPDRHLFLTLFSFHFWTAGLCCLNFHSILSSVNLQPAFTCCLLPPGDSERSKVTVHIRCSYIHPFPVDLDLASNFSLQLCDVKEMRIDRQFSGFLAQIVHIIVKMILQDCVHDKLMNLPAGSDGLAMLADESSLAAEWPLCTVIRLHYILSLRVGLNMH